MLEQFPPEAQEIIRTLGLEPLEHEGGYFRRMHLSEHSSAIYYLLAQPEVSALHRLSETEVYHWYGGSPLEILVLHPDGRAETLVLGPDLSAGQRPQHVVPGGTVHGSRPLGAWSFVGTTMAPPFHWDGFELGDRDTLIAQFPEERERIIALTRPTA